MRIVFAAVLLFCASSVAYCQSKFRPLLRIGRSQSHETVCVLVNDDGGYRLEKAYRAKDETYLGTIDRAGMDSLHKLLGNDQLRSLSQGDIRRPLISDTPEFLDISINRDYGWQELSFFSPESRKSVKESVNPLLHWFEELQKHPPAATRVEGTPSRCVPPRESRNVVSTTAETAPNNTAKAPPFLFRFYSSHAYVKTVESSCTIVFNSGRFHQEHSSQTYGANRRDKIAEGQVDAEALQELRSLLDSPDLKESQSDRGVPSQVRAEGFVTALDIPRSDGIQHVALSSAFNAHGDPRVIGGNDNLSYHVPDQSTVKPLQEWMKEHTDKRGAGTEKAGNGNDCYPGR